MIIMERTKLNIIWGRQIGEMYKNYTQKFKISCNWIVKIVREVGIYLLYKRTGYWEILRINFNNIN